jgi:hypothetical protein
MAPRLGSAEPLTRVCNSAVTITANSESLKELGRNKVDINQLSLGLVY